MAGAATGFAFCFTASSSSSITAGDEADAAVGVGRDRALNDGREKRSNETNPIKPYCPFFACTLSVGM